MNDIHSRLRKLRQQKRLTIQEVSEITGIPASTYKEWENGRRIRGEPYHVLAQLYEVSIQELITGQKSQISPVLKQLDDLMGAIDQIKKDLVTHF